jgi:hypothetical protein
MVIKILPTIGLLLLASSCATRYILPGNKFMTPETQGGALRGQFEIQQTNANLLAVNTNNGSVNDGVVYRELSRTGFLFSNSFFDAFDAYWSHTASANAMFGGKIQILGGSRTSNTAGHKAAVAIGFGGNKHETNDKTVSFTLNGQENFLLYGYRFSEFLMPYANLSYSRYAFDGKIKSNDPALSGKRPSYDTKIYASSVGLELSYLAFVSKLECTYQQLDTRRSKDTNRFIFGYSLGLAW